MKMLYFRPDVKKEDNYAVSVYTGEKTMVMIQTYSSLETLEEGYKKWLNFAKKGNLSKPYPIKLNGGKCGVLTDIVERNK